METAKASLYVLDGKVDENRIRKEIFRDMKREAIACYNHDYDIFVEQREKTIAQAYLYPCFREEES